MSSAKGAWRAGSRRDVTGPSHGVKEGRTTLRAVQEAVRTAWSSETSIDRAKWSPENPAWGQCAVTALVIQDFFGGHLQRAEIEGTSHYWNRLPSGDEVDLTIEQFGPNPPRGIVEERERAYVLSFPGTVARYEQLWRRVCDALESRGLLISRMRDDG